MAGYIEYDARKSNITVDGRVISRFADGDMFSATFDQDSVTGSADAKGDGSVAINNAQTGTITINLSGNSKDNAFLNSLANSGKKFPVVIDSPLEKVTAASCYIKRQPQVSYGKNVPTRTFTILALDMNITAKA